MANVLDNLKQGASADGMSGGISGGQSEGTGGKGSFGVSMLRITLGIIILATWLDNVRNDFYDGDNFEGFFNWAFTPHPDGNGSSLTFFKSFLDATLLQNAELFGWAQTLGELTLGILVLLGIFTRAASLGAAAFFFGLFLTYFGGEEWIWTYVILVASSLTVFLNYGGRMLGVDQVIAKMRGDSPGNLLW